MDAPPWTAQGTGPIPPMPPPSYPVYDADSAQYSLSKGIKTAMVGVALFIGLGFIGYHSGDGPFGSASIHPGPWLLGGLIPMFVGIAQIITALMSGAQFGMRPRQMPPNSGGGAAAADVRELRTEQRATAAVSEQLRSALRGARASGQAARSHLKKC